MPCRYQICYLRVFTVKVSGDLPKTLVKLAVQEIKECGWCASAVQKRSCLHSLNSVVSLRLLVSLGFCGQGNNCNVLTVSIETNRFTPLLCLKVTSAAGISGLGKDNACCLWQFLCHYDPDALTVETDFGLVVAYERWSLVRGVVKLRCDIKDIKENPFLDIFKHVLIKWGAHNPELATLTLGLCQPVFTDRFSFMKMMWTAEIQIFKCWYDPCSDDCNLSNCKWTRK